MAEPRTADPRLASINFDVLDMDLFPPVAEWTEDDWEEAGLLTLAALGREESDRDGWVSEAEIEAEFGPLASQ